LELAADQQREVAPQRTPNAVCRLNRHRNRLC
jgi:hypothetical protein